MDCLEIFFCKIKFVVYEEIGFENQFWKSCVMNKIQSWKTKSSNYIGLPENQNLDLGKHFCQDSPKRVQENLFLSIFRGLKQTWFSDLSLKSIVQRTFKKLKTLIITVFSKINLIPLLLWAFGQKCQWILCLRNLSASFEAEKR